MPVSWYHFLCLPVCLCLLEYLVSISPNAIRGKYPPFYCFTFGGHFQSRFKCVCQHWIKWTKYKCVCWIWWTKFVFFKFHLKQAFFYLLTLLLLHLRPLNFEALERLKGFHQEHFASSAHGSVCRFVYVLSKDCDLSPRKAPESCQLLMAATLLNSESSSAWPQSVNEHTMSALGIIEFEPLTDCLLLSTPSRPPAPVYSVHSHSHRSCLTSASDGTSSCWCTATALIVECRTVVRPFRYVQNCCWPSLLATAARWCFAQPFSLARIACNCCCYICP